MPQAGLEEAESSLQLAAPSLPRLAVALLVAVAAFGVAFAVSKAGADEGGDGEAAAPEIKAPSKPQTLPGVAAPVALPGLRSAPSRPSGGGGSGGGGSGGGVIQG